MKKIEDYTKMDLYEICKLFQMEVSYQMNHTELYDLLTNYYKKRFTKGKQEIYFSKREITGYCGKDEINCLTNTFNDHNYYELSLKKLKELEGIEYNEFLLKELTFFLGDVKYYISDESGFELLVIETEDKFGFMAPKMEIDY